MRWRGIRFDSSCFADGLPSAGAQSSGCTAGGCDPVLPREGEVIVTIIWLMLIGTGIGIELYSRRTGGRWSSPASVVSALWTRLPGRLLLVGLWAFAGWHV